MQGQDLQWIGAESNRMLTSLWLRLMVAMRMDVQEEDEEAAAAAAAAARTGVGAAGPGPSVGLSMQERLAQQRQIFNPREAFSMLSRELKDIMRQNDPMLEVDTVDNDVYFWDIHLYRFEGGRFAEVHSVFQTSLAFLLHVSITSMQCPRARLTCICADSWGGRSGLR